MSKSDKNKRLLRCPKCGLKSEDNGCRLDCSHCMNKEGQHVILEFERDGLQKINKAVSGLDRYIDFMPFNSEIKVPYSPLKTIESKNFAHKYGFKRLYFTCTGFSEKIGIEAVNASFKDLEAICTLNRLRSYGHKKPLILASAGNTARSFSYYAAKYQYPIIIVVPDNSRNHLWLPDDDGLYERVLKYVKLVFVEQPGNYSDASALQKKIYSRLKDEVISEGGFFNIARICGLGLCAVNFYDELEEIPKHYIQAVGSAVGPLSVLRAYKLLDKNNYIKTNYHLVQNFPYTPLTDAIEHKTEFSSTKYLNTVNTACAPMLTSSDSTYNYPGGIADNIKAGMSFYGYGVKNEEIYRMQYELWKCEKIQVLLPAAASLVGLLKAKESGRIKSNDLIQLNLTGIGDLESMSKRGFFYIPSFLNESVKPLVCTDDLKFDSWFKDKQKEILRFK